MCDEKIEVLRAACECEVVVETRQERVPCVRWRASYRVKDKCYKLSYLHFTPRTGSQGAVYQLVARGTEWPLARGTDKAGRPSFGGRGELQRVGTAKAASAIVRPEVARVPSSPSSALGALCR